MVNQNPTQSTSFDKWVDEKAPWITPEIRERVLLHMSGGPDGIILIYHNTSRLSDDIQVAMAMPDGFGEILRRHPESTEELMKFLRKEFPEIETMTVESHRRILTNALRNMEEWYRSKNISEVLFRLSMLWVCHSFYTFNVMRNPRRMTPNVYTVLYEPRTWEVRYRQAHYFAPQEKSQCQ